MRYLILVKATQDSEAGVMPADSLLAEMGKYHEELAKAGLLVDGSGLQASSKGWRIRYNGKQRSAVAWTKRFPNPAVDGGEAEIEVRQYFELEDFGDSKEIERFRKLQKK
jgi:hypothetical protein